MNETNSLDDAVTDQAERLDDAITQALVGDSAYMPVIGLMAITALPVTVFAAVWTIGGGWLWSIVAALWSPLPFAVIVMRDRARRLNRAHQAFWDRAEAGRPVGVRKPRGDTDGR